MKVIRKSIRGKMVARILNWSIDLRVVRSSARIWPAQLEFSRDVRGSNWK